MKKILLPAVCAAVLLAACLLFADKAQKPVDAASASSACSISNYCTANAASSQESGASEPTGSSSSAEIFYIVREYNGHIGVFRENETEPFRVIDTDVKLLPAADQKSLALGKRAATLSEVEKLLEDYDG